MNEMRTETELRLLSGFEQVSLWGNTCSAQLFIVQGEQEGLAIEAPPEYLRRVRSEVKDGKLTIRLKGNWLQELEDALSSCADRPPIIYRLTVRELTGLDVQCASMVYSSRIETPHLSIKLNGLGDFRLDWLTAEKLEVQHSGAGVMRVSGRVDEQNILLTGIGSYLAPELDCLRAGVRMSGAGVARLHVRQSLDINLRGVGSLEYSGDPVVRKRVSGPGQVKFVQSNSRLSM